ncbi:MAG: sialidase family protein [Pseudomonadota bacterium]
MFALSARRRSPRSLALFVLLVSAFALAIWRSPSLPVAGFVDHAVITEPAAAAAPAPAFASRFVSHASERFVHAASMTALPDGGLYAAWFGGTREGADDVRIYGSRFDPASQQWSAEQVLVTRELTEAALGIRIRKLGNPVLAAAPDGRIWLLYVSVSLGGWATSNLNLMTSADGGQSWSAPKRLVMTPFFNLSTLVRGKPLFHADGSLGVPVYHEALAKFPEYARIDADGRVLDKVRMDYGRDTLQPYVVALSENDALALLRDDSPARAVSVSRTSDAGRSWSAPQLTDMPNPNAAIAAVRYNDNELLVALNDLKKDRYRMSLYRVDNALQRWQLVDVLDAAPNGEAGPMPFADFQTALSERFLASAAPDQQSLLPAYLAEWSDSDPRGCKRGACEFRYDYPYLLQTSADRFELMYSWNKSMIKHVSFTRAWIESKAVESKAMESKAAEVQP